MILVLFNESSLKVDVNKFKYGRFFEVIRRTTPTFIIECKNTHTHTEEGETSRFLVRGSCCYSDYGTGTSLRKRRNAEVT